MIDQPVCLDALEFDYHGLMCSISYCYDYNETLG